MDMVITGADRISGIGDAANKIGTYEKAVLAHENSVPFYIAAPRSTMDFSLSDGNSIPIEERDTNEIFMVDGRAITADRSRELAINPAFDVTPAELVTAIITDKGIAKPPYTDSIKALFT